jgi:hypothetical protein
MTDIEPPNFVVSRRAETWVISIATELAFITRCINSAKAAELRADGWTLGLWAIRARVGASRANHSMFHNIRWASFNIRCYLDNGEKVRAPSKSAFDLKGSLDLAASSGGGVQPFENRIWKGGFRPKETFVEDPADYREGRICDHSSSGTNRSDFEPSLAASFFGGF